MVLAKKEMSNTASKYYGFLVCFVLYEIMSLDMCKDMKYMSM